MREGTLYLSFLPDMALVRVEGLVCEAPTTASSLACFQILSLSVSSTSDSLPLSPSASLPPFPYELSGVSHPRLLGE